jgi:hypothetical protein
MDFEPPIKSIDVLKFSIFKNEEVENGSACEINQANVGGANAAIATTANGGTLAAGSASVGRVQFNGSAGSIIVNTTAVTPSSLIFITPMGQPGTLWVRYVGTGSFSIHTTNVTESCAVNWMIVN